MVNKPSHKAFKQFEGGPPPLDEAWWESVLQEYEAQHAPSAMRSQGPAQVASKTSPAQPAPEPVALDWELASRLYLEDRICDLDVTGYNRGGLLVCGNGLHGFVPVSHLTDISGDKKEADYEELLAVYINRRMRLKIIECDEERGRVVFSERAALAKSGSRNELLNHLRPGDCVYGTVTNITDFGVFVDLGGVEGLVHVSEISWGRVRHPSDVVKYGDDIEVYVIQVEPERSRVALSLKRLHPNPWETAETRYRPGQITEAVITSIVPFGAFARLEEGLDGLIHISEMGLESADILPSELFHEGQRLQVRVLHVDASKQRLGLSTNLEY